MDQCVECCILTDHSIADGEEYTGCGPKDQEFQGYSGNIIIVLVSS